MQTEYEYRGMIVRRVKNETQTCLGFKVDYVYQVVDEFDEPAIPAILEQNFWSPYDAKVAIDFSHAYGSFRKARRHPIPETQAYEFSRLQAMRRHIVEIVCALEDLRDKANDANEFGEDLKPWVVIDALGRVGATKYMA